MSLNRVTAKQKISIQLKTLDSSMSGEALVCDRNSVVLLSFINHDMSFLISFPLGIP